MRCTRSQFWLITSLSATATLIALGLWPFRILANDARHDSRAGAFVFSGHGMVRGEGLLRLQTSTPSESWSIEMYATPAEVADGGTLLSLEADNGFRLSIRQVEDGIRVGVKEIFGWHTRKRWLSAEGVVSPNNPVLLTITSGPDAARIYIDGRLQMEGAPFPLRTAPFEGSLVLADSQESGDGWSGELFGVAVYAGQLSPDTIRKNHGAWSSLGRPAADISPQAAALYLFDGRREFALADRTGRGPRLAIPITYQVLHKLLFEPFWVSIDGPNWMDIFNNIIGFIPFGFCVYGLLVSRRWSMVILITVLAGLFLSLMIETVQGLWLATRDSDSTDVLTNTLGTFCGAWAYRWVQRRAPDFIAAGMPSHWNSRRTEEILRYLEIGPRR